LLKYWLAFLLVPYFQILPQADSCLVISEVMFFPQGSNNEFVEIYNSSEVESVYLDSLKIKYWNSQPDIIIPVTAQILPPKSYAVVFEGDYDFENGIYKLLIPANAVQCKISDNAFGSSGMANTSSRPVSLLNRKNELLDFYYYSADNTAGFSDEKIILNKDSSGANWKNSLAGNGTPGKRNSVSPYGNNLAVRSLSVLPALIIEGENASVKGVICNKGFNTAENFALKIVYYENPDSVFSRTDTILSKAFSSLPSSDSVAFTATLENLSSGVHAAAASVEYAEDEYPDDNFLKTTFAVAAEPNMRNDIVINEIMYAPAGGMPEWLEIFNKSAGRVNLKNWLIGDKNTNVKITSRDVFIEPQSYLIITKDSSIASFYQIPTEIIKTNIPSLNNDGDAVVLKDSLNKTIDSLEYSTHWGGSGGYSLERVDADSLSTASVNWGSSINKNKASPGLRNSIALKDYDLKITRFSPQLNIVQNDSPVILDITIKNAGKKACRNFSVNVYADVNGDYLIQEGELLQTFSASLEKHNDTLASQFAVTPYAAGKNIFILTVNFNSDEDTANNTAFALVTAYKPGVERNGIAISEIMHSPKSPQPEWVEIFNNSAGELNINKFRIADNSDTVTVVKGNVFIKPGEYFIITDDSSIYNFFPGGYKSAAARFPPLNNTGDKVILLDSLNRVIDSLSYEADWCSNGEGNSLERIDLEESPLVKSNWGCPRAHVIATPGMKNSIAVKYIDPALESFSANPESPLSGSITELTAVIKNLGKNKTGPLDLKIYADYNGDSALTENEIIKTYLSPSLNAGDSVTVSAAAVMATDAEIVFYARLNVWGDEDTLNNAKKVAVRWHSYGAERNDLAVNEIMYAPPDKQTEWIEVYNRSIKSIDLQNYKITDAADTVLITGRSILIAPSEYLVIAGDSSITGHFNIASKLIVIKLPQLNNNGDKVIILDNYNRVIDSVKYNPAWGGVNGKSLERIDYDAFSNDIDNWKTSVSPEGATPGKRNSASRPFVNIAVKEVVFSPAVPLCGEDVSADIKIINKGLDKTAFVLSVYEYSPDLPPHLLFQKNNPGLAQNDSVIISTGIIFSGIRTDKKVMFSVSASGDEDTSDNSSTQILKIKYPSASVLINEIMYNPTEGEPEWIEFFNTLKDSINIAGWKIADSNPSGTLFRFGENSIVPPLTYFVTARDSSLSKFHNINGALVFYGGIPQLNNDEDQVILKDSFNYVIDSVSYNPSFGGKAGFSLERRSINAPSASPANWGASTSPGRGTPGGKNSIAQNEYNIQIKEILFAPKNAEGGDSVKPGAVIYNSGSKEASAFIISFFYAADITSGSLIPCGGVLYSGSLKPSDSLAVFSPEIINNAPDILLIKAVISYAPDEIPDDNSLIRIISLPHKKNSIIINEIMYEPLNGESEWIELYNPAEKSVDIGGWSASDYYSTPVKGKISGKGLIINPGGYFIVAKDSSFIARHPSLKMITAIAPFGQLNNGEDGVLLYDEIDSLVCSAFYKNTWGGGPGISLERLQDFPFSNDSLSWKSSVDAAGCTPGMPNSHSGLKSFPKGCIVINEFLYDPLEGDCEYIEFLNTLPDSVNTAGWNFNCGNRLVAPSPFTAGKGDYLLLAADSSIFSKFQYLKNNKHVFVTNTSGLGLDNSGSILTIKDFFGNTIDSVSYTNNWGNKTTAANKGKSLERINPSANSNNPDNWGCCADALLGTPCAPNSINQLSKPVSSSLSVSPNPFSPDNDGYEDITRITYSLKSPVNTIRIKIFDSRGRLIRTLTNNSNAGSSGSVTFDGKNDDGNPLRMGIYIILFEALNSQNVIESMKTALVVARRL
jgi:hypothetical protein